MCSRALRRHAFGVTQVAEGEARLGVGDGAGLVVFGDGFEVAHGDREAARVRREADELFPVLRQDDRLEDVESTQPTNLRLDHAGLRVGHHEALGHDVVAEKLREIRTLEHERTVGHRHLRRAARFAHGVALLPHRRSVSAARAAS